MPRTDIARRALHATARRLGPARGEALLRTVRAARDLVLGHGPAPSGPVADGSPAGASTLDGPPAPSSAPQAPPADSSAHGDAGTGRALPPLESGTPVPEEWPEPPTVERTGRTHVSLLESPSSPPTYDLDLFLRLNEEYADKPIVPAPPQYDPVSLRNQAQRRLAGIHQRINLQGKRTLEIGCGNGFEVWTLAHVFGGDAHGVDVADHHGWPDLQDEHVHFTLADIARDNPFPSESFDRILSFTVWEHIEQPRRALEETYRMLAPGGVAWIRANLWMGPMASHRYRDVYFPWPHLLFGDDVFRDFYRHIGKEPVGAAWVNRLSWLHYLAIFDEIGFVVRESHLVTTPIDEDFHERFVDVLGRYPREDLERDFFRVILQRPLDG